jgi:superfamily II DNA/RNA helicase
VLHVDPPQDGKDYLHRSGRTARAGESGVVVLLATSAEERAVRCLLADAGVRPQQRDVVPGDRHVALLTGARRPNGTPVATPRPPQHARPAGRHQPSMRRRPHSSRRPRTTRDAWSPQHDAAGTGTTGP